MDPNWVKNAMHKELPAEVVGQMLRFMMLSISKELSKHLIGEEVKEADISDYAAGVNDCAVRILDVIGGVMEGGDPVGVAEMSDDEMMEIINSL